MLNLKIYLLECYCVGLTFRNLYKLVIVRYLYNSLYGDTMNLNPFAGKKTQDDIIKDINGIFERECQGK